MDPFASHVLRALLLLLNPDISNSLRTLDAEFSATSLRSKKSTKYRAKHGPMKSVLESGKSRDDVPPTNASKVLVPEAFREMAGRLVKALRESLGENEVRALAANKVACPVLAASIQSSISVMVII